MSVNSIEVAFAPVFQAASPEKRERMTRSINDRVAEILHKEGISAPPLEFHVALIDHATKADAYELADELNKSDIFIPEIAGVSKKTLLILNRLSNGEITPREAYRQCLVEASGSTIFGSILSILGVPVSNFQEFETGLNKILYKSGKKVAHVDLKNGNNLIPKISEAIDQLTYSVGRLILDKNLPFHEARKQVVDSFINFGLAQKEREEHMLKQLPNAIAKTILENEELQHPKKTEPIRVFMFLGASHTTVPKKIKELGDTITYKKSRRGSVGRENIAEKTCSDEMITEEDKDHLVLENIFSVLYRFAPKPAKKKFKKFVNRFNEPILISIFADVYIDRAEKIYDEFKEGIPRNFAAFKNSRFIISFFITLLKEREAEIQNAMDALEKI